MSKDIKFIDDDVRFIMEEINKNGFEAYIVGGCVRDILLEREPKDFDITTSALPEDVKKIFPKTFDTGIEHGTVTVVLNKTNYEVTTFRIDGEYKDSRRPEEVIFTPNLKEDLSRRDFTVNAIAYSDETGYVDLFNGMEDLKNKIIRGVGNPDKRFKEDALRIMRAIRFSAQLGFDIEDETYKGILENRELLKNISVERIREELIKTISGDYIENLKLISKTEILKSINPKYHDYLRAHEDLFIEKLKNAPKDLLIRISIMLQFLTADECAVFLTFLKFDNLMINNVSAIVKEINFELKKENYFIKKLINRMGKELFLNLIITRLFINLSGEDFEDLKNIYDRVINEPIFLKDLKINGNDLKNIGITDGKKIGKCLNYLLDCVLKNAELNNFEDLKNESLKFCDCNNRSS